MAAKGLAQRIAEEKNSNLGAEVGYEVRFDSRVSAATRICFQTYGLFLERLKLNPALLGVGLVILDELHERSWEMDWICACLHLLMQRKVNPLKVIAMSATLDTKLWLDYFPAAKSLEVVAKMYPVEILYQPSRAGETIWDQAARAYREASLGNDGNTLVFMPGKHEINKCLETLSPLAAREGAKVYPLHGSLDWSEQQKLLSESSEKRVIVATNIAETSLTLPKISLVIDSGLARVMRYDGASDRNTLFIERITQAQAEQRKGRAGRTGPGKCIRLWDERRQSELPERLEPEVERIELVKPAWQYKILLEFYRTVSPGKTWSWLSEPKAEAWERAMELLTRLSNHRQSDVTHGTGFSDPRTGHILTAVKERPDTLLICSMLALLDSSEQSDSENSLFRLAQLWIAGNWKPKQNETTASREQLFKALKFHPSKADFTEAADLLWTQSMALPWMQAYYTRIASGLRATSSRPAQNSVNITNSVNTGQQAFTLLDGRKVSLVSKTDKGCEAIIALEIMESLRDGHRRISASLFLPLESKWIETCFPDECQIQEELHWDTKRTKQENLDCVYWRSLKTSEKPKTSQATGGDSLVDKLLSRELVPKSWDEQVDQYVARIVTAAKAFPEYGIPLLDNEDWQLIFDEYVNNESDFRKVNQRPILSVIQNYLGSMRPFVERSCPSHLSLPRGKQAQLLYSQSEAPEISARIADFLGMRGKCHIAQGLIAVRFNILAPNYRSTQKTWDLDDFWNNTYHQVRKELRGRYPRHPWPEDPWSEFK